MLLAFLADVQLLVLQDHQVLFRKAVPQTADPPLALLHELFPSQMQDFLFAFVELNEIPDNPLLQPVEVPLNISPALQGVDCSPPQSGFNCKLVPPARSSMKR